MANDNNWNRNNRRDFGGRERPDDRSGDRSWDNFGQDYGRDFGGRENRQGRNDDRNYERNYHPGSGRGSGPDYDHDASFRSGADYGSYGQSNDWDQFTQGDRRFSGGAYGRGRESSRETSYGTDYSRGGNRDWSANEDIRSAGFNSRPVVRNSERYERDDYFSSDARNDFGRGYGSDTDYDSFGTQSRGTSVNHAGRGPKGWKRSDDRIKDEVSEALERHPEIDASEIEVSVKEGLVTLSGSVDHRRSKRMAEDIIDHIPGVKDVRNELTVNQSLFEQAREFFTGESKTQEKTAPKGSSRH